MVNSCDKIPIILLTIVSSSDSLGTQLPVFNPLVPIRFIQRTSCFVFFITNYSRKGDLVSKVYQACRLDLPLCNTAAIISHFSLLESRCLFHWILFGSMWNVDYNFFHQYSIRVFTTLTNPFCSLPESPKYEMFLFLLAVYNCPTSSSFSQLVVLPVLPWELFSCVLLQFPDRIPWERAWDGGGYQMVFQTENDLNKLLYFCSP